jgi:hypothetical protein
MAETGDMSAIGDLGETAEMADLPALLDALRASGAAARDPVRFAYIAALARRAATQPPAIRQALTARISAAARELAARPAPATSEISRKSTTSPLAELLAYISQHAHEPPAATETADHQGDLSPRPRSLRGAVNRHFEQDSKNASASRSGQGPELKSVAYFRNEWSKLSTEQQLTQTLAQAPENAGPMNSQHLVLRSLERMRDIAPDYLQGFMSYIDTLIWLEHADPSKPAAGRAAGGESENKKRTAKRGLPSR